MKQRVVAGVMAGAVLLYGIMLANWAVAMMRGGSAFEIVFGLAILAVPVVGVAAVIREIRFGLDSARLARRLSMEDGVPLDTLERDARGRVDPGAADIEWQRRKAIVDGAPEDWRAWFLLGVAYDNARDRRQARAAIRRAIALANER